MELGFKSRSLIYSRACSDPLHCTVFSAVTCIQITAPGFCTGVGGGRGERRQEEEDGLGWAWSAGAVHGSGQKDIELGA